MNLNALVWIYVVLWPVAFSRYCERTPSAHITYSQTPALQGAMKGITQGSIIGVIKRDTYVGV